MHINTLRRSLSLMTCDRPYSTELLINHRMYMKLATISRLYCIYRRCGTRACCTYGTALLSVGYAITHGQHLSCETVRLFISSSLCLSSLEIGFKDLTILQYFEVTLTAVHRSRRMEWGSHVDTGPTDSSSDQRHPLYRPHVVHSSYF